MQRNHNMHWNFMNIRNPNREMNLFSPSLSVRNSTGWDIMEAVVMVVLVVVVGGCVCGFVYSGVTFFFNQLLPHHFFHYADL